MLTNILAYADDCIPIAPSKQLQQMLNLVAEIGHDLQIKLNPEKSAVLTMNDHFSIENKPENFSMNEKYIPEVETITYLGHIITSKMKASDQFIALTNIEKPGPD